MSADDARAAAHVDGYLVGAHGRPCDVPAYDSIVLRRAWIRGWQIGRSRMPATELWCPMCGRTTADGRECAACVQWWADNPYPSPTADTCGEVVAVPAEAKGT